MGTTCISPKTGTTKRYINFNLAPLNHHKLHKLLLLYHLVMKIVADMDVFGGTSDSIRVRKVDKSIQIEHQGGDY